MAQFCGILAVRLLSLRPEIEACGPKTGSFRVDSPEAKSPPHEGRARCSADADLAGHPEELFLCLPFKRQLNIQEPVAGQRCRLTAFEDGLNDARTHPA